MATPIVLACDESISACEQNPFGNYRPDPGVFAPELGPNAKRLQCRACVIKLDECHTLPGIDRVSLSSYTEPGDAERAQELAKNVTLSELRDFMYKDINVGEHAHSSLLRATLRGTPLEDERTLWLARRYLASCIELTELGERVFRDLKPDHFVAADGMYVLAGTLGELARKRGIHVVVHGAPYRKGTVWLSHRDCYHKRLVAEKDDAWTKLEMLPERTRIADDYLASKHFVSRDYTSYHVDAIQNETAIKSELGLDDRPIVSLFTNILWDSQLYYRFNVFPNMLEWLFQTIRFFGERKDVQLVVRLHPAEAPGAMPTNQPILPEIEKVFARLPDNVKIVRPESKVSSYVLGTMSRTALIYGARVGVELVMLGTPVVVAGEAFLRNKGFSYDPTTREEYFELIGRELPRVSDEVRARATKWYYQYFFRMMMPFPFYEEKRVDGQTRTRLTFESLDALLPGRSPVLDRVCQGILDESVPFEWDEFEAREGESP